MKKHILITLLLALIPYVAISEESERKVGLSYPDAVSTNFLKEVLKSLNLKYEEVKTNTGVTVYWHSQGEEQEMEIQNRVSQYTFLLEVCESKELPSPSSPAKAALSCQ